jgi:ATP-dependent Clp protease adaptor protein ClpS
MTIKNFDKEVHELETDVDVLEAPEEVAVAGKQLVVYNDDFNTFDHVIDSLIKVCKHDPIQAEQCTFLIHYKGKCSVKKGSFEELEPMCTALLERGITAEIE